MIDLFFSSNSERIKKDGRRSLEEVIFGRSTRVTTESAGNIGGGVKKPGDVVPSPTLSVFYLPAVDVKVRIMPIVYLILSTWMLSEDGIRVRRECRRRCRQGTIVSREVVRSLTLSVLFLQGKSSLHLCQIILKSNTGNKFHNSLGCVASGNTKLHDKR